MDTNNYDLTALIENAIYIYNLLKYLIVKQRLSGFLVGANINGYFSNSLYEGVKICAKIYVQFNNIFLFCNVAN